MKDQSKMKTTPKIFYLFVLYLGLKIIFKLVIKEDLLDYHVWAPMLAESVLFSIVFFYTMSFIGKRRKT